MESIHARVATPVDAPDLARLNFLFNETQLPVEHYLRRMATRGGVDTPLVAVLGEIVVGMANLRLLTPLFYEEPYAELTELYVEEGYRRKGAAQALVSLAEALARQAGAEEMLILTDFTNHAALTLYRKSGYRRYEVALNKTLKEE